MSDASEEGSSPYYRKVTSTQHSLIPSTWNMMDREFRQFIVNEFYWPIDEITPEMIQTLLDQHEANRIPEDDQGRIVAPLLVAIPIKQAEVDSVLLMLIRSLNTSIYAGSCKATKHGNQVALINSELKLKAIPSHLPLMCLDPQERSDKSRVVYNTRADQRTWLIPEICVPQDNPGCKRLNWISVQKKLNIGQSRHVSVILGRIQWARGPWIDGPEEKLLYNDSAYRCHRNRRRVRPPCVPSDDYSSSDEEVPDETRMAENPQQEDAYVLSDEESSYEPSITLPLAGRSAVRLRSSPRLAEFRARSRYSSARSRSKSSSNIPFESCELPSDDECEGEAVEPSRPHVPIDPDPTELDPMDVDENPLSDDEVYVEPLAKDLILHPLPQREEEGRAIRVEVVREDGDVIHVPAETNPLMLTILEQMAEMRANLQKMEEVKAKEREEKLQEQDKRDSFEARMEQRFAKQDKLLSDNSTRQRKLESQNLDQVHVSRLHSKSIDDLGKKIDNITDLHSRAWASLQKGQQKQNKILARILAPRRPHPRDYRRNPRLSKSRSRSGSSKSHSSSSSGRLHSESY